MVTENVEPWEHLTLGIMGLFSVGIYNFEDAGLQKEKQGTVLSVSKLPNLKVESTDFWK